MKQFRNLALTALIVLMGAPAAWAQGYSGKWIDVEDPQNVFTVQDTGTTLVVQRQMAGVGAGEEGPTPYIYIVRPLNASFKSDNTRLSSNKGNITGTVNLEVLDQFGQRVGETMRVFSGGKIHRNGRYNLSGEQRYGQNLSANHVAALNGGSVRMWGHTNHVLSDDECAGGEVGGFFAGIVGEDGGGCPDVDYGSQEASLPLNAVSDSGASLDLPFSGDDESLNFTVKVMRVKAPSGDASFAAPATNHVPGTYRLTSARNWTRGNIGIADRSGNLSFRTPTGPVTLRREGGAPTTSGAGGLASLGQGSNSVSQVQGDWQISSGGNSLPIKVFPGTVNALMLNDGSQTYGLDRLPGIVEKYTGNNIEVTVVSATQLALTINGQRFSATRSAPAGGSSSGLAGLSGGSTGQVGLSAVDSATGNTALHRAVASGDRMAVDEVLSADVVNVSQANNAGDTALHLAIRSGNPEIVSQLVGRGASINSKDRSGKSALELAAAKGDMAILDAIRSSGSGMNTPAGHSALKEAIRTRRSEVVLFLLDSGVPAVIGVDSAIDNRNLELFDTIAGRHPDAVSDGSFKRALDAGVEPIAESMLVNRLVDANAATQHAISKSNARFIELGLVNGADAGPVLAHAVSAGDENLAGLSISYGANPDDGLQSAVAKKHAGMVRLLVGSGADPNQGLKLAIDSNETPLVKILVEEGGADPSPGEFIATAAQKDNLEIVRTLLHAGAASPPAMPAAIANNNLEMVTALVNESSQPADPRKPEHMRAAGTAGDPHVIKFLVENGADPDQGMVPALTKNRTAAVQMLLGLGADGSQPQHMKLAARRGNAVLVGLFIEQGAPVQAGMMPAVEARSGKVVRMLLENGADGSHQDYMVGAVSWSAASVVDALIDHGYSTDYGDPADGSKLIHSAALVSDGPTITALLRSDVDVNAKMNGGDTPLHLCVKRGKAAEDAVEALIRGGADVNAENDAGKRPLQLAKSRKVKKALKQAGAKKK